jgi:hypothetical protein
MGISDHTGVERFVVKDSGERREFSTGSVRDRGDLKPRPDYISPFALLEVGEHMRKGAEKYGPFNWGLGQPFSEMTASMFRHLLQWIAGDADENHLAAIVFNAQALMHFRHLIAKGVLPAELDDMPRYEPPSADSE